MVGAVILTFIITTLTMFVLYLSQECKRHDNDKKRILRDNEGLRRQISECTANENRRRECYAYDKGLYDGRRTDTLYRNVLKRYSSREQVDVMMNGEQEEQ